MKVSTDIITAIKDPQLLGKFGFNDPTFRNWRAFLRCLYNLPMNQDELALYKQHTARETPPRAPFKEAWIICGRRAGKSRIASLIACYTAAFTDFSSKLAPGEKGVVMLIGSDRKQARVLWRYVSALFEQSPVLSSLIERKTREILHLANHVSIEVHTPSFRSTRGYAVLCFVGDEVAFWDVDEAAASPDKEVLNAIRPSLASTGGMMLCISSPFAKKGALYTAHKKHYGKDDSKVLVWQAATRDMNRTIPESVVAEALETDPQAAAAEWLGKFRSDISSYIDRESLESCVVPGRTSLPYVERYQYSAFVDVSSGRQDSFALAIAHREADKAILDLIVERKPPLNPSEVIKEFCKILKEYEVNRVKGDKYFGQLIVDQFKLGGVKLDQTAPSKSDLYKEVMSIVLSGKCELLDHERMITQFTSLERRIRSGGRDVIAEPAHSHDDCANAAAGAVVSIAAKPPLVGLPIEVHSQGQQVSWGPGPHLL